MENTPPEVLESHGKPPEMFCKTQPVGENHNTTHTMRMTSSKCVLQQRHLLCYESEPDP